MPLTPPETTKNFVLTPAGSHLARLIGIIQLGTQETTWQGQVKFLPKIRFTWELVDELHLFKEGEEPKPFIISQDFTLSMGDKSKLRPIVEGMVGKLKEDEAVRFDMETLLGKACILIVVHAPSKDGTKTYANIASTAPLMKGQVAKEAYNPTQLFTFENWSDESFGKLPQFIQDKIKLSAEYPRLTGKETGKKESKIDKFVADDVKYPEENINVDDIPF